MVGIGKLVPPLLGGGVGLTSIITRAVPSPHWEILTHNRPVFRVMPSCRPFLNFVTSYQWRTASLPQVVRRVAGRLADHDHRATGKCHTLRSRLALSPFAGDRPFERAHRAPKPSVGHLVHPLCITTCVRVNVGGSARRCCLVKPVRPGDPHRRGCFLVLGRWAVRDPFGTRWYRCASASSTCITSLEARDAHTASFCRGSQNTGPVVVAANQR